MNRFSLWAVLVTVFALALGCARSEEETVIGDDYEAGAVHLDEAGMYARIVGNSLEVYFPMTNDSSSRVSGSIELTCRHLTDDYAVDGNDDFRLEPGEDFVVAHLDTLPSYESVGDQAQYVIDYQISMSTGTMKGARSLFMLLDKSDLVLMVPDKMYEGHASNLRAFLLDPRTGKPISDTALKLILTDLEGNEREVSASTDEMGLAVVEITEEEAGSLSVRAVALSGDSEAEVETGVEVVRESKLLLTSDKPLYQPSQTMHLRALALDRFDHHPLSDESAIFEVMDAKGNKVFKQEGTTNQYGVAWARFTLGSQVLLGTYTLKVTVGDVETEKSVTVDRYSLPKFKVDVRINKSYYTAGQTVQGEVNADYFFGKPVSGGEVKVVTYQYQAEWVPATESIGQTNADGFYAFDYKIPDYVVGQPLEGGKALILMEVTVTDTAEHSQTIAKNLLVVQNPLDIAVIPESGSVVPGVANNFYVFVNDPTGNPVQATCTLTVNGAEMNEADDQVIIPAFGPAVVSLTPHAGILNIEVEADDGEGGTSTATFDYSVGESESAILLRTNRSVFKVGETVEVTAYVVGGYNHVFLDVIRKNQTVLTHTLEVVDGVGSLMLDLDQEMSEELVLNAYMLAANGQFIRDSRIIYVQPASDLNVTITTDKEEYLPGDTALVEFEVKDVDNQPTQAALGIQIVDEAVYALSEIKPGLLKLYFYLEDELTNPTYQIGPGSGASFGQLFAQSAEAEPGSEEADGIENTTTAALSALGDVPSGQTKVSSWSQSLSDMKASLNGYYTSLSAQMQNRLEAILALHNVDFYDACTFLIDYFDGPRYVDAWGQKIHLEFAGGDYSCNISFTSAGPDETMDTEDDFVGTLDLYGLMGERWKGGGQGWFGDEMAMNDGEWGGGMPTADAGTVTEDPSTPTEEGGDDSAIRIRSWFPETLFVAPSLITGEDGKISVEVPLADSITEWRMTTLASSMAGQLGSRSDGIVVFQDFFVDIDFPKYLTQNDEISFPVAIYNYLETAQTVEVQVEPEDWFQLLGADSQSIELGPGEVSVVYFPVKVLTVGWHSLTVYGIGGNTAGDAIMRTVEVKPDGTDVAHVESARFDNDGENPSTDHITQTVTFPTNAIDNSQSIVVKVLPGLSSHIVQGMDSIFQLPGGCFEQTTSSAWPNVLALKYMQEAGSLTPEIEMQAIEYVNIGYQRILTFECESGGFNWWEGDNPGNAILSAVGVMMLTDTKSVYGTVDQAVIDRSADYLFSVQKADGSWSEESHLHAGNENLGASSLRGTCYITWALAFGGYEGQSGFSNALNFIKSNVSAETDNYTRAMCANALVAAGDSSPVLSDVLGQFHDDAIVEENVVHWSANGSTLVNSYGDGADVEVTALVALAMGHKGSYPSDVNGAVEWLVRSKDPQGNWGYNTQATVLALRTFLMALTMNPGNTDAHVDVYFNGEMVASRDFDNFNKDVVWQVELTEGLDPVENVVELDYNGTGALSYQIVDTHYIPWDDAPVNSGPLDINVDYDSTTLEINDTVTATVTITNNQEGLAGMVLATIGIPPGFTLVTQDLAEEKAEGILSMYETMGKQLILYFDSIPAGQPIVVTYSLVAQYPIKAQTGGAEVSMYYDSTNNATQDSQEIEVVE